MITFIVRQIVGIEIYVNERTVKFKPRAEAFHSVILPICHFSWRRANCELWTVKVHWASRKKVSGRGITREEASGGMHGLGWLCNRALRSKRNCFIFIEAENRYLMKGPEGKEKIEWEGNKNQKLKTIRKWSEIAVDKLVEK